ncbi:MAG: hypothetical protein ACTSRK_01315 [Promethearchaeota archaeon]
MKNGILSIMNQQWKKIHLELLNLLNQFNVIISEYITKWTFHKNFQPLTKLDQLSKKIELCEKKLQLINPFIIVTQKYDKNKINSSKYFENALILLIVIKAHGDYVFQFTQEIHLELNFTSLNEFSNYSKAIEKATQLADKLYSEIDGFDLFIENSMGDEKVEELEDIFKNFGSEEDFQKILRSDAIQQYKKMIEQNIVSTSKKTEWVNPFSSLISKFQNIDWFIDDFIVWFMKLREENLENGINHIPFHTLLEKASKFHLEWKLDSKKLTRMLKKVKKYGLIDLMGINDSYPEQILFKPISISKDPIEIINYGKSQPNVSISGLVTHFKWDISYIKEILTYLQDMGFIRSDKSYLHGERFFFLP